MFNSLKIIIIKHYKFNILQSIDAGASSIEISTSKGGLELIRVKDNGEGMTKEELILACQRYTTSKITVCFLT